MRSSQVHFANPSMLASVMLLWSALNAVFFKRYIDIVLNQTTPVSGIIAILIVMWIFISSFYACFHIVSFVYSVMVRKFSSRIKQNFMSTPSVAVLYLCMNDLKEKAVLSLINQNYPDYHLYVLDDSTIPEEQERVDRLQLRYPELISIIRRPTRQGFKAGNLNHAIEKIGGKYKYFAVMDADEIAPDNFLRETVAISESDSKIGFVQARHRQYGDTEYGKKTGDGIDLHWSYFLPARNKFGFVYFYGHGALIRTKASVEAGGIPEIASEDVALAVKMRELGYHGYYADNVVCYEEVPPSYAAWRKQHGRVIRGTLEFLVKYFPSFAKSKNVSMTEKIDLLISSSLLFLPLFFLCFILLLHVVMPFFSRDSYSITGPWSDSSHRAYIHTAMGIFKPLWGWDTFIFTIFTIFAPLCYIIPNLFHAPAKVIRYMWRMTTIHLSATVHVFSETFGWLWSRQTQFVPTGSSFAKSRETKGHFIESTVGILLITISVIGLSPCLLATGLSIALVPLLIRTNLQGRLCATLVLLPMTLTIISFGCVPLGLLGVTGAFAGMAFAHH